MVRRNWVGKHNNAVNNWFYLVRIKGRSVWCKTKMEAQKQSIMAIDIMRTRKLTGMFMLIRVHKPKPGHDNFAAWLNGDCFWKLVRGMQFVDGEIVDRYANTTKFSFNPEWLTPEMHPSVAHSSWVRMCSDDPLVLELVTRAPDWRSMLTAFKLSKITVSTTRHKLTQDIAKYLWNWAHNVRINVEG